MVVLVEVIRKAYLASIVPVIVNSILDHHQLVVDIVAFVSKGDFPRSRLGEKQRGKILAAWVTRKMRTIAQFSIRDNDGADSQITEVAEPRSGLGSAVDVGSSLRNVESATSPAPVEVEAQDGDYTTLPTGISEMPADYESSIVESPRLPNEEDRDDTPTEPHHRVEQEMSSLPEVVDESVQRGSEHRNYSRTQYQDDHEATPHALEDPEFDFNPDAPAPAARYESKPRLSSSPGQPGFDLTPSGLSSLPSQQRYSSAQYGQKHKYNNPDTTLDPTHGLRGGLQVPLSTDDDSSSTGSWRQEALMQMNLARGSNSNSRDGSQEEAPTIRNTTTSNSSNRRDGRPGERGGGVYDDDDGYDGNGYGYGHAM